MTNKSIGGWRVSFGATALLAWFTSSAAQTAFVDVGVISMDRDGILAHQTVVVDGDRIEAIGPSDLVRPPRGARQIRGTGRYLIPGLIDMHVHFVRRPSESEPDEWKFPDYRERNRDFGLLFVANGITTVRQPHAHAAGDELQAQSTTSSWLGPAIYSTGPITDGDPPIWPIARIVTTPAQAQRAVADDKRNGYIAIKVYDNVSLGAYDAIVSAAMKAHLDVIGHIPRAVGLAHAIESHQATIEHADSFAGSLQPGVGFTPVAPNISTLELKRRADLSKLADFADAIAREGIWVCPTMVVEQMESSSHRWDDEQHYISSEMTRKLIKRYAQRTDSFDEEMKFDLSVVSELHAHGAGLLLGTDTFKANVVPGFSALSELEYFVQAGLTPFEALATGTINAAKALHQEALLGSVEVGKRADLILLDANPLDDVRNVRKRVGVMLRGRWLPESKLRSRLDAIAHSVGSASPNF